MRRWPLQYLPIALLALTLQALAPLMAVAPLAAASFDPLTHAALCSELARVDGSEQPLHRGAAESGCCALCAPLAGGTPALEPPGAAATLLPLYRRSRRLDWRVSERLLPSRSLNLNAPARAPPAAA